MFSDIIINCITIACITVGFFEKKGKIGALEAALLSFGAALRAVEKYKFYQSKGKPKIRIGE